MKKVLFVATVASHIRSFHLPYLKLLKDHGYEVHVAAKFNLNDISELDNCDVFHNISIERKPLKFNNVKAIFQLKKIINNEKFDLIHCHTPMGAVVARIAAISSRKKYGTRVIYTAHGLHFFKGAPLKNWLLFYPVEKFLSRFTDTLILINQEDYDLCKRKFKKCKDIQYVPGVGIDEEKFNFEMTKKEKKELRESLGLKDKDFVMIFVARMDINKNQGLLINCTKNLINKYPNIKLLLVGPDERNGYYQKMVSDYNLEENVLFLGYRKDISRLMKIADIALSSSLREGLAINIMEALICNIPVIATDIRGHRETIINNYNGFLFSDLNELENHFEKLYSNNKEYNRIKNNCHDSVKKYLLSNCLSEMNKIYNFSDN